MAEEPKVVEEKALDYGLIRVSDGRKLPSVEVGNAELEILIREGVLDLPKIDGGVVVPLTDPDPAVIFLTGLLLSGTLSIALDPAPPDGWLEMVLTDGFCVTTPATDPAQTPYVACDAPREHQVLPYMRGD